MDMAAIDSLLKLMDIKGADGLVVVSNGVPSLNIGGEIEKLSMPAIPAELIETFASEVIGQEYLPILANGEVTKGCYVSSDGVQFMYSARLREHIWRLEFQPYSSCSDAANEVISGVGKHEAPTSSPDGNLAHNREPHHRYVESDVNDKPIVVVDWNEATVSNTYDLRIIDAVEEALAQGASDVFLTSGEPLMMRVGGTIRVLRGSICEVNQILNLGKDAFTDERRARLSTAGSVDLAIKLVIAGSPHRFRMNIFHHHNGLAATLRPIKQRPPRLDELSLPIDFQNLGSYVNGLVLITGPAGSGKSSTLAAIIEHINQTRACHIITLEDPIEFEHKCQNALVHQREVGLHVESFRTGLHTALRESPDVILLGEMRDLPTISAALTAAETGHLVLSTLHSCDPASAVDRIIDIYPGHQQAQVRIQLASVLRAVVSQMLIPSIDYPDLVPAFEKLIVTHAVANQIREGRNHQLPSAIQAGASEGMVTLERCLASLVDSGKITLKTAIRTSRDVPSLRKLVAKEK